LTHCNRGGNFDPGGADPAAAGRSRLRIPGL
jgi:hypothetical protein